VKHGAVAVVACLAVIGLLGLRPGVVRTAAAPVLGVAGERLTVDGAPRFLVFFSYFDGVRRARSGSVAEDLEYLSRRVDGVRVLPNWWAGTCPLRAGTDTLIDLDGNILPQVWNDLERLLDAAAAQRLAVDLTFTRETVTDNGSPPKVLTHEAYERALVELIGGTKFLKGRYPNLLVDVQNEWTRFASAAQMEQLLARVHEADPQRLLAASVSGDGYVPVGRTIPTMIAAYHDPRDDSWFAPEVVARHVRAVKTAVAQPVYLQEPMPASTACQNQLVDRDMTHFAQALDSARQSGAAAWTFHTRTAFDLAGQSLVEKLRAPAAQDERRAIEAISRR